MQLVCILNRFLSKPSCKAFIFFKRFSFEGKTHVEIACHKKYFDLSYIRIYFSGGLLHFSLYIQYFLNTLWKSVSFNIKMFVFIPSWWLPAAIHLVFKIIFDVYCMVCKLRATKPSISFACKQGRCCTKFSY